MSLKAEFEALPIAPQTVSPPEITRSVPQPINGYEGYRPHLRKDFFFSCAYCKMAEFESIGHTWQIDHYKPVSKHAAGEDPNVYSNLHYSCDRCNRHKSDLWPTPVENAVGKRFLRPDADNFADHIELDGEELKPLTRPGLYTIRLLNLNRSQAKAVRKIRKESGMANAEIQGGLQVLRGRRIDRFSQTLKGRLENAAQKLQRNSLEFDALIDDLLIAELNKHEMMDPDPVAEKMTLIRKILK